MTVRSVTRTRSIAGMSCAKQVELSDGSVFSDRAERIQSSA
jgi:hypothetical protein